MAKKIKIATDGPRAIDERQVDRLVCRAFIRSQKDHWAYISTSPQTRFPTKKPICRFEIVLGKQDPWHGLVISFTLNRKRTSIIDMNLISTNLFLNSCPTPINKKRVPPSWTVMPIPDVQYPFCPAEPDFEEDNGGYANRCPLHYPKAKKHKNV